MIRKNFSSFLRCSQSESGKRGISAKVRVCRHPGAQKLGTWGTRRPEIEVEFQNPRVVMLAATAVKPGLLDVGVGHASDVVRYGASEALRGDLRLMIGRELARIRDEGGEEFLNYI